MNNYTFVKIRNRNDKNSKGSWYLIADSLNVINEHWMKYCGSYIREGTKQFFKHIYKEKKICPHYTNGFGKTVQIYYDMMMCSPLEALVYIENEALRSRIDGFAKGYIQYLTKEMTILMNNDETQEIVEKVMKNKLVYPDEDNMVLEDVRFIKWEGGEHWYAKIGKIDIIDEYKNQKWNTKEEAENAAKWYIKNNM